MLVVTQLLEQYLVPCLFNCVVLKREHEPKRLEKVSFPDVVLSQDAKSGLQGNKINEQVLKNIGTIRQLFSKLGY